MQNLEKLIGLKQEQELRKQSLNGHQDTPKIQQQLSLTLSPQMLAKLDTVQPSDHAKTIIIGICGGPSSGKVLFSETLRRSLQKNDIYTKVVKQENFEISESDTNASGVQYDFYGAHDWIAFQSQVQSALNPQANEDNYEVVIIEGTLIFANEQLRNMLDIKIYLDTDEDIRLSRRIYKDVCIKKKDIFQSVNRYLCNLKPLFEKHIVPTKRYADIVVPNYGNGYSSSHKNEYTGGFATFEHAVIDLLTTNVKNRIVIEKKLTKSN